MFKTYIQVVDILLSTHTEKILMTRENVDLSHP